MKTNLKGLLAASGSKFVTRSVARFSILLLSCLLSASVGWGQTYLANQSFDATTFVPTNWTNFLSSGSNTWTRVASGTYPSCSPRSGAGMAKFNSFNSPGTGVRSLITPVLDFSTAGTKRITFWMYRDIGYSSNADKIEIYTNTSANLTAATLLGTINRSRSLAPIVGSDGWYEYYFDVTTTSATTYVIFKAIGAYGGNIFLDDIKVEAPPTPCSGTPSPGNTIASTNPVGVGSSTTLSLQNTTSGSGVTYQWESSTDNTSWSNVSGATSATYAATPSVATYYRCNVTCSGNTGTSNSLLVNLTYCTSTGPATQGSDYFTNFTITNGITNFNNTSTYSTNGYADFTGQSASQYPGSFVDFSMTSPGVGDGSSFGIFIDWNQDFDFLDANEQVFLTSTQPTTNPTGTFTVPVAATAGSKRMRIVVKDATGQVSSCNSGLANSETEDYTFTVVQLPACSAPTSLASTASSTAQSNTNISASFTAANSAPTAYLVVRTDINTQPVPVTGTTYTTGSNAIGFIEYVGATAGSWTSTSLTPGTTYYYWVFSYNNTNCTGGPVYSASATSFSQATSSCTGAALANLSYSASTASYCTGNAITTNTATLGTTSGTPAYTISPALPTGLAISSSTGNITGTPTTAQPSTAYTVTADNGCTSTTATVNIEIVTSPTAPTPSAATSSTYSGFTANWTTNGASSYELDVALDASFNNIVSGFNALNVGNVGTYSVTGLNAGITYYYRIRAVSGSCISANSTTISIATTAIESAATGNWNATTTWNSGTVPVCGDVVNIANTHNVTVNSSSNVSKNLTINSGGTLTIASGDLTVGCTLNNTPLTNNGTLTVTGGILNVNGNITSALGSTFNQSGGDINIDGNNGGSSTGSVASGTPLLNLLQLNSGINWTGGTLTIVDPHTATTNTNGYAVFYSNSTTGSNYPSANHTIQFGNGVSTDAGGHTSGFYFNQWEVSAFLPIGSCVVNGPSGVNRSLNFYYSPMHIQGNVSVNNGGLLNGVSVFYIGGNILVNSGGSFINPGTVVTGTISSNTGFATTPAAVSIAQSIGGAGTYSNLATSSTANLTSLTVNNTSSSGVTISAPLSLSGTLTMTAGKINTTATNLLTLGTSTAAGTLSYTAGQIAGPFARTFAASSSTTAVYDNTTLFPVGDGTNYIPIHIDPVNGGGVVQMRGQAFNTNTGTAGTGVASVLSTDRWEALVTTGTITDCFIGLNDAQIASGNVIAQSSSASGTYNAVSGASTFVSGTPNALRTAAAIPNASYSGYFTYAAPGPAITSFTPTSVCPGTVGTITVTGTNLGSATSVTLNGEACTITANSATSLTFTTDATPQAGNIVVTTAANSATSATAVSLYTLPTVTATSNASNNTVCSGTSVTLSGGGASSYVWNNGVLNSTSFTPIATNSYTVTGTDANGCTNTASITITVNNAVSISSQPVNAVVLPNTNATFTVTATGTSLTYQWEENTGSAWSPISNGGIYSGATTNTLTLTNVSTGSGNQYRCVISGTTPCAAATTSHVTLTISSTAITAQPQNQSICESAGTATFTISTSGTTPTYQWELSTDGGSTWSPIVGETNSSLSLSSLTTAESGRQYHCVLNGNITSSSATLTVSPVSVSGTVSSDQAICSGSTPSSITLSGNTGSIQWQVSTDNSTFNNISGATSSPLAASTIGALTSTRYYRAVVTSGGCSAATSGVVTVTVTPTPNAGTLSGTQVICANSTSSFTSNGDAGGAWTSANTAVATVNNSTGVVTGVAAGVTTITYTITGTGGCTTTTATRTVTVNALPSAITLTPNTQTICAGNIQSIVASGGNGATTTSLTASNSSGTISLAIPDNSATGISSSLNISSIPSSATITKVDVTFDLNHAWLNDAEVVLTAPNGKVIALAADQGPGAIGAYSNCTITSDISAATLSTTATPISGTYKANATLAASLKGSFGTNLTQTFTDLFTTPNGTWILSAYDDVAGDLGTLTSYSITITYTVPNITWSPTTDLYTNAAATTAYTGTPTTVYSKPTANRTYTATATTSNGCTSSASVTINYSGTPLATAPSDGAYVFGATSNTNYNTAANWYTYSSTNGYAIASAVPTSSDIVVIPATSTCVKELPSLSATSSITDVEIQSGAILSLNGNTLSIAGALSGAGTIKGSATSSLSFTGTSNNTLKMDATTAGTTNVLKNLTLSGTGTTTLGNALNITAGANSGSVTAGTGTTLTTGGYLTLKSNASGTARIAQSAGTISGNVTQERFVPGKAIRKWSFLASPVTQSLASAWQQQIHITGAGTGGTMCNNYTISGTMTPHTNGFDVTQLQNPSFYTYDAATDNFVANTTGTTAYTLTPGDGYMVLVRGDRNDATNGGCVLLSANNQAAFTATSVTLAATGAVGQGTITKVLPAGYSFIGNPYPCEIDFPGFNTTNTSVISGGYWTYYPTNATYTFSTYNNGTSTNGGTQVIANGQSFLVNSTSGGTITFNEAHKSTTANNGNFRLTKTWDELIRVGLSNNQGNRYDEVVVRFANDAAITKAVNEYDAASVNGGDQWIKTLKEATELAIQTRPNTYLNDTVSLAIHAKNAGTYQLGFSEYQGLSNTEVYLIDQQENLIQNVKALPSYEFSVGANTTTANRFKLIFDAKTSGVAALAANAALQVYPNPTKDKVRITCSGLEYGAYQIKVRTITGAEVLKAKGTYYQNEVIELSLQDLAAGMYMLELSQDNGFRAIQKITKH